MTDARFDAAWNRSSCGVCHPRHIAGHYFDGIPSRLAVDGFAVVDRQRSGLEQIYSDHLQTDCPFAFGF